MPELILFAIAGLLLGGALNVAADRLPPLDPAYDGPFIADSRRKLAWWEWFPIASFTGAMRARRMVIANNRLRYPVLELGTAALFVLSWYTLGDIPWHALIACAFCASFLTLAAIDLETKYLPSKLTYPTLALALATSPLWPAFDWWEGYAAAAGTFAFFYGVYFIGERINRPLMGDADAFLAAAIAAVLGISLTLVGLYITAVLGGIVAMGVVIAKIFGYEARVIPYGPYLVAGGLGALFWGQRIIDYIRPA